jgi:hypothetical protein
MRVRRAAAGPGAWGDSTRVASASLLARRATKIVVSRERAVQTSGRRGNSAISVRRDRSYGLGWVLEKEAEHVPPRVGSARIGARGGAAWLCGRWAIAQTLVLTVRTRSAGAQHGL